MSASNLHIAIIMDGNGRWARSKMIPRTLGHRQGAKHVQSITRYAIDFGVTHLTLYAFSTENWKRPKAEVDALIRLFGEYLDGEHDFYMDNKIRFNIIGDWSVFDEDIQVKIKNLMQKTKHHTTLVETLAVNYGGQDEIIRAIKTLNQKGLVPSIDNLQTCLDTYGLPPVDLMIRTGGHQRLSNFLLWQSAYAELSFTDTYWPAFSKQEFEQMIYAFKKTLRNFGGLEKEPNKSEA